MAKQLCAFVEVQPKIYLILNCIWPRMLAIKLHQDGYD